MKCFLSGVITYNVEGVYPRFGETLFHHVQGRKIPNLKMKTTYTSETYQVHSSQTTRRRINNVLFTAVETSDLTFHISYSFFVNITV
jgi:hypothetical protein